MPSILFYIFAILMLAGGVCVVSLRNPVASAMGMIGSFVGIAALLIGLNAYFVGTLQVLVYAGAIMVLFVFIIMLLDLKKEEAKITKYTTVAAGIVVPLVFVLIMIPVLGSVDTDFKKLDLIAAEAELPDSISRYDEAAGTKESQIRKELKSGSLPDVNLIGQTLFTEYNFPLQVVGVLLLVSAVGCVALSKKLHGDTATAPDQEVRYAKTLAKSTSIPQVKSSDTKDSSESASSKNADKLTSLEDKTAPEDIDEATVTSVEQVDYSTIDEKRGLIYTQQPDVVDDLKSISGVEPDLEKKLNEYGIYTYKQIAGWSADHAQEFDNLIASENRITSESWVKQAKELHDKKYL